MDNEIDYREEIGPQPQGIDKTGWISLGAGFLLALAVFFLPFLNRLFHYLLVLLHEFGHAFWGWLFGYFCVPAFTGQYGGGVTSINDNQNILIIIGVYFIFAFFFYLNRNNIKGILVLCALTLVYSLCAFTHVHNLIVIFMGHGSELIFAGIFFYRAISGRSIVKGAEQPLYAFAGFYIEFNNIKFAWKVIRNPVDRIMYDTDALAGHANDFSVIAKDYLHIRLETVFIFFLCCTALPPILAFLMHRYRSYLIRE